LTPPGTRLSNRARVCYGPSGSCPPIPFRWLQRAAPLNLFWTPTSRTGFLNPSPVYHGSVCLELRIPAQTCHYLPLPTVTWHAGQTSHVLDLDRVSRDSCSSHCCTNHTPHRSAEGIDPARAPPISRGLCTKALTVDGRHTTMTATQAHLPPWSPFRFSMRLQWHLCRDIQGYLHYSIFAGKSQYVPAKLGHVPSVFLCFYTHEGSTYDTTASGARPLAKSMSPSRERSTSTSHSAHTLAFVKS